MCLRLVFRVACGSVRIETASDIWEVNWVLTEDIRVLEGVSAVSFESLRKKKCVQEEKIRGLRSPSRMNYSTIGTGRVFVVCNMSWFLAGESKLKYGSSYYFKSKSIPKVSQHAFCKILVVSVGSKILLPHQWDINRFFFWKFRCFGIYWQCLKKKKLSMNATSYPKFIGRGM